MQEVNAVTMAVEQLHPDVGSVIELGGQDAKIIIFKETADRREARDRVDERQVRVGHRRDDRQVPDQGRHAARRGAAAARGTPSQLHHVAAKCGVFAETDIVNLVKSGIPSAEIMCSLADAIVLQNLSVLTRGNTLQAEGAAARRSEHVPAVPAGRAGASAFRRPGASRGFDYPKDVPLEELIVVPDERASTTRRTAR